MPNVEKIFDLSFCADSRKNILTEIKNLSSSPHASSVIFANAHVVVESHWDPAFLTTLNSATLIVPDGVPISWLLRAVGHKSAERYSGPDLMLDIFEKTKEQRHFFIGSTTEVLEKIRAQFRGNLAGTYSPPFTPSFSEEEKQKQLQMITTSGADYIWVGLGAPKQEKYAVEMANRSQKGVWLAVGAAFDFYAGNKARAPEGVQQLGLEWAWRMFTEPKRLTTRYLKTNPVFINLALKEYTQRKRKGL